MADNSIRQGTKVSVCIPCYNAADTIAQAIDSALSQDIEVEVIVVNDCSVDDTSLILDHYSHDSRVRILTNTKNLGAAESRNKAVLHAKGRYVAYLDADDRWEPHKLRKQVQKLESTGHALCCTGRELLTPDGLRTGRVIGVRELITYQQLLRSNSINCSSVVMPAYIARAYPMKHEDGHEDYITWLKLLREKGPADGIDEPLLLYRLTKKGKSGSKLHSAKMTFRSYRYAGIGPLGSAACFGSYALTGIWKYMTARQRGRHRRPKT